MERIDPVGWLGGQAMPETVLLVVNRPIHDGERFRLAWNACKYRAVLDGAANSLLAFDDSLLPDFIIGDLDSISSEARKFYEESGIPVIEEPSQYATDLGKAVTESMKRWPSTRQFFAFNGLGGRVDHSMHSIMSCLRFQEEHGVRLMLHSEENISFVVNKQAHVTTTQSLLGTRPAIGIAPLFGSCEITTTGLMWDIVDWETSFSTQVTTSNYLVADSVTLKTTKPVLFTLEV